MWIRLETGWQRDPYVVTLHGLTRHLLCTVWCLAAERGTITLDDTGEPKDVVVELQLLEPTFLAHESGLAVDEVIAGMERLRAPTPAGEWTVSSPPRVVVDVKKGTATIRNVGKWQEKALRERERNRVRAADRRSRNSTAVLPGTYHDVPARTMATSTSTSTRRNYKDPSPPNPSKTEVQKARPKASPVGGNHDDDPFEVGTPPGPRRSS